MARMTIAQIRAREVEHLAHYKTENPTDQDMATARLLMNSFYRLCGLADRNLYMANNERLCDSRYCAESEERESRWIKSLSARMYDFCGLIVDYHGGYLPEILKITGTGRSDRHTFISGTFYR